MQRSCFRLAKPRSLRLASSCFRQHLSTATRGRRTFASTRHVLRDSDSSENISDPDHPFYNYTSGRWLYNEALRLSERRHHFNNHELCHAVAKSVNQSVDAITSFTKIAEGGSNRVFEATFQDGMKVIARLPYPSTIPRKYGVASEVATMEFLRLHGVPVPKVFDWSASTSNPVGAEYIFMERVEGRELGDTWYSMSMRERMDVVEKIVDVEKRLFSIRFPACGSLYFKESLDPDVRTVDVSADIGPGEKDRFCVGPSTELLWWYQKRDELAVNRGPWKTSEALLTSVGQRELLWLQRFGEPRFPREPLYREFYGRQMVDPQVQIENLSNYLKVAPHIVPESEALNQPTIRHPDLSPNNIFMSESGDITGVIDWQHTTILPIFLQAKIPKHFQNHGDADSDNFQPPKLPENFASLTDGEKEKETEIYRRRQLHYFYLGFTSRNNKPHFNALPTHDTVQRNRLYDAANRPWEGDNTSLRAEIIHTSTYWPSIATSTMKEAGFPVKYSEAEVTECLNIDAKQKEADGQMQVLREFIGVSVDGWVASELFEVAREKECWIKHEMLEEAETEGERSEIVEHWPFQDYEEVD